MTKVKKGVDYSKVTPALVKQVKDVIADADKHTYSVSKVYAAHNAAFGLREQPQTCSSCLRNRARDLRDWLKAYDEYAGKSEEAKRLADEAEAKRLADEAEAKRLADEAEAKRLADEAEAKRLADEAEAKRLADEAEAKRLADEAEAKRLADEAEAKRLADEAAKDQNNPQYDAPAPGVVRIPMKEGAPIDLTPASEDDQTKGTVSYADGSKVAPGKYTTARGETIVVQVGSKGRIEVEDLT